MSLINDALKRASQSDRSNPRQAETQGRLKPVVEDRASPLGLALGTGVLLALALAGWFFWQWWHARHPPASATRDPLAAVAPKPEPPPGVIELETPPSASAPASAPVPPATAVEQAWPADLKLMAIFFRKTNPMALINGQTLGVGDQIEGIRVTKIERNGVLVEWHGQVKELMTK